MTVPEAGLFLHVQRALPLTPERAFALWTDPEAIRQWFGGEETEVPTVELDLRPGGAYLIVVDGDEGLSEVRGEFERIEPGRRLVYSWRLSGPAGELPETTVDVRFHPDPHGTTVEIHHGPFPTTGWQQLHLDGWHACLARLPDSV